MAALWGLVRVSRAMKFPGSPVRFPPAADLARHGIQLLETRTTDGLHLTAAWVPPRSSADPCLVYFHGNAESAAQNLDLAELNAAHGWGLLLVEYRGYGGMPGSPTETGLYADAEAALASLTRAGIPASRVILVGRSLGTGVAVEMACRGRGQALVLISAYTSMVEMGRSVAGFLAPLAVADRFDNAAKVGALRLPALVLHGARDEVVPYAMGLEIARRLPGARFVAIPNAGHNDLPSPALLLARELPALLAPR
jgi:fermentation-respiration switch protein FrsA (DUF1100 family)